VYMCAGQMSCETVAVLNRGDRNKCVDEDGVGSIDNASATKATATPAMLKNMTVPILPGGIPKVLHQIYSTRQVPKPYQQWFQTWNTQQPDWMHVFWTDADIRAFLEREHPSALVLYDSYGQAAGRYDVARAHILWSYGGVYADMDLEAVGNLTPAIAEQGLYLVDSPYHKYDTVQNSLMASRPQHPFWSEVFKLFLHRQPHAWDLNPEVMMSGPGLLSAAVKQYQEKTNATTSSKDRIAHLDWQRFLGGEKSQAGAPVALRHAAHERRWRGTREGIQRGCIWMIEVVVLALGVSEFYTRRLQVVSHWDKVHKLSKSMDMGTPGTMPLKGSGMHVGYGTA